MRRQSTVGGALAMFSLPLPFPSSTLLSTVVTVQTVHVLGIPTFVFSNVCTQVKLVNILTYVPILSYKTASISHNSNWHAVQYKRPVATWPSLGVVSLVYCLYCGTSVGIWRIEKCRQPAGDRCIANGMRPQSQTKTLVLDFSLRPNHNLNSV